LWKLTKRLELGEKDPIITVVEARSAELMRRLGAKAGTQNVDRILRLPGTINLPNAKKLKDGRVPCPTKLLGFNGAHYSLDSFPPPVEPEQNKSGTPEDGGQHERQQVSGDKLERIIRTGGFDEFETRSHGMWWVINEMMRRGYPDIVIVPTLLDRHNKISAHIYDQPNPRPYAERNVAEAREKFKATSDAKGRPLPESQWFGEKLMALPPALIKGVFPKPVSLQSADNLAEVRAFTPSIKVCVLFLIASKTSISINIVSSAMEASFTSFSRARKVSICVSLPLIII
jgi:hypothetical protein